jgi:Na+/proline symporter
VVEGAPGSVLLSLGAVVVVVSAVASCATAGLSAGACVFGLDFLRGFIRAGREKELSRR